MNKRRLYGFLRSISFDELLSYGTFCDECSKFPKKSNLGQGLQALHFFFFFNSVGLQINIKVIYIENNFKMHFNTFISYFQYLLQKMIPIHDLK